MGRNKKNEGLSTLQLLLIITGSIVAAVGIIFLIMKFCKKNADKRALKSCYCDDADEWEFDDDLLDDLRFDDGVECGCCCDECEPKSEMSEEISAAVDEAIEAISSVAKEEDAE